MVARVISDLYKLFIFKKKWKRINPHNFTTVGNIFSLDLVSVGNYSYGTLNVHSWGSAVEALKIGSFVSIAHGVKFILGGNHSFDSAFSYPFKVKVMGEKSEASDKGVISVDHDVWIGMDSMILSGVSIGQGAVVTARSLISKDVPPYAVVGGNPAKIIKYRFDEPTINKLLKFDFSLLDKEFIEKKLHLLYRKTDDNVIDELLSIKKP